MRFVSVWFDGGLFAMNVALGSIFLGLVAFMVALLGRRAALSLQHALLTVALTITLASPLAIWVASSHGIGIVPFSLASTDRSEGIDRQPLSRRVVGAEKTSAQRPWLLEDNQLDGAKTTLKRFTEQSTEAQNTQPPALDSNLLSADFAGGGSLGRRWGVIERVGGVFAVVWAAVALYLTLRLARGLLRVRQLQCSLHPATDPRLVMAARRALSSTGQTASVPVYESLLAPAPLTLGCWQSVIVMPQGLASSLGDVELACVLAHEAAHVARHDSMIALLQQLSGIAFWWNPLLRTASREISRIRERICDDHVVKQIGDGIPLARAIVKVAEWSMKRHGSLPIATNFLDDGDEIEQRLTQLCKQDRALSAPLNGSAVALTGFFGIVLAAISWVPAVRGQVAPPPPSVAPTQLKGWQVQVRAVDADGKPIVRARLGVQLGASDGPVWHDGDAQGRFVATLPKREPGYCYLMVRADGYAPMRAFWRDALPSEFTFEMTKAVTVGGLVQDEAGKPIAGATVLFSGGHHDAVRRAESSFYQEKFTTDERGRWKCDLAPVNMNAASINVRHPDYANDTGNYGQDQRIPELLNLTHTWTMKKGFSVTGRVVDTEGKPITGATLAIGELNLYRDEGPFEHTGADGRYRFKRVAPHYDLANDDQPTRFTVSVLKPGFMPVMRSVPGYGGRPLGGSTKDERVVDLTLKRGATLKLRVVDSQSRPIKGASVIPDNWHGTTALRGLSRFGIPAETDEQGIWRWTDAPLHESIEFDVLKPGFSDVRKHTIRVDDATVEKTFVLKQPQVITGTVIDASTKQPIPEFIVEQAFENVGGYPDGLFWTTTGVTGGKNGAYRKQVTMPPHNGSYTYRARAAGYETSVSKSIPFTEGETTVNFEVQRKSAAKPD